MQGGGAFLSSGQDDFNSIELQLNEQIKALKNKENTLLAKMEELEDQNTRLQNSIYITEFRFNEKITAFRRTEETLLTRVSELEEENTRLQNTIHITMFQFNDQITAFRNTKETLLARVRELEEEIIRLQNTSRESFNEPSVHVSSNETLELSAITGEFKECRYLSDLLTELQKTESEKIQLKPGDDLDSQERPFEAKISFSKKAIQSFLSEYQKLEKERNKLRVYKNKNKSENKTTLKFKELNPDSADIKTFSDCRIIADSLFSLLWPEKHERWQIEYKDWGEYQRQLEKEFLVVSVIGNECRGKSFIISQVLGHIVPQGKHQRTVGLHALYPHENSKNMHCIALDTPGTNIAVRTVLKMEELERYFDERNLSQAERLRRLYGDVRIMESLLHEFVMQNADILVVVVDRLVREDQQFLNSIIERNKIAKKRILVVHNWSSCNQIKNVEELIKYDIKRTFTTQERFIGQKDGRKVYAYDENTPEGVITHVIMAHEGTPAGEVYNDFALKHMREIITVTRDLRKFDLVAAFKQYLEMNIENHLYKIVEGGLEGQEELFSLQVDSDSAYSSLFLKNARTYDLKNSTVNEIGVLRTFIQGRLETVPYVIKYVQIIRDEMVYEAIQIEFEVCGNCRELEIRPVDTTTENVTTMTVTITAISEDNGAQGVGVVNVIESTRSFGRFKILTGEINLGGLIRDLTKDIEIYHGNSGLKTATIFLTTINGDDGWE